MATSLKLRTLPRFLASIFSGIGTSVRKDGLATYIDIDFSGLAYLNQYNPAEFVLVAQSLADGSMSVVTISQLLNSAYTEQDITTGDVTVQVSDGMVKINKTVGAPTSVILPLSSAKLGPVTIVDWKGDAGTNNITVTCSGSDKFNGNTSTWMIAGNGASVVCTPLKDGTGYAI